MKKNILYSIISLMMATSIASAEMLQPPNILPLQTNNQPSALDYMPMNTYQTGISSRRLPQGAIITVRMENPINTMNSKKGDGFHTTVINDIKIGNDILIPKGTILRGNIEYLKQRRMCSRSAEIKLNFDHLVTPVGREIPVYSTVINAENMTKQGIMSAGGGYFSSMARNMDFSTDLINTVYKWSETKGRSFWNGYPVAIMAPVGMCAGIATGGTTFFAKSLYNLVTKGKNVTINNGDIFELRLKRPMDIPVN